jgi:hypothetical protein
MDENWKIAVLIVLLGIAPRLCALRMEAKLQ